MALNEFEESLIGHWVLIEKGYSHNATSPTNTEMDLQINADRTMRYLNLNWRWRASGEGILFLESIDDPDANVAYRFAVEKETLVLDTRTSEGEVVFRFEKRRVAESAYQK